MYVFDNIFSFNLFENFFYRYEVKMVDWATQDRLYPAGYQPIDRRYRRTGIDSSLPFSVALTKSNILPRII